MPLGEEMNIKAVIAIVVVGMVSLGIFMWQNPKQPVITENNGTSAMVLVSVPDTLSSSGKLGKRIFEEQCASCHGRNAAGQEGVAPPLIHKIYEPSHHGDESFQRAAALGVRAHHWPFGNMPPIEGLTRADVSTVITYVRELQRANGIH